VFCFLLRTQTTGGRIQFTVFNWERAAMGFCPGSHNVRGCDSEHYCLGGGGYYPEGGGKQCGDFSGWDWDGYGRSRGHGCSASKRLTDAAVLFFTRP